jgi:hypothetical protein
LNQHFNKIRVLSVPKEAVLLYSFYKVGMVVEEEKVAVRESVRGISEWLGLDPFYLAKEGKLIAIYPPNEELVM